MNDDLISRAEAIEAIFSEPLYESGMKKRDAVAVAPAIYEKIKSLPSAEPQRKKGQWTDDNACQFCGFQPWFERDIHTLSFCPNCGADMRGADDE